MRRLVRPGLLMAVWLSLWGEVSWGNVATGVVAVGFVLALYPTGRATHRLHAIGLVVLAGDFALRLIQSSWTIAIAVLAPTPERMRTGVVEFPLRHGSSLVATILADAISLTPGTLTLDVLADPPRLAVHVMGLGDPDEVLAGLRSLEDRVLAAVEPIAAVPDAVGTEEVGS